MIANCTTKNWGQSQSLEKATKSSHVDDITQGLASPSSQNFAALPVERSTGLITHKDYVSGGVSLPLLTLQPGSSRIGTSPGVQANGCSFRDEV